MSEPTRDREACFKLNRAFYAKVLLGCLGFTIAGAAIAAGWLSKNPSQTDEYFGWGGVIFFGGGGVFMLYYLLARRGCIIWMTSYGIRDARFKAHVIPWAHIREVTEWSTNRMTFLALIVEPAYQPTVVRRRVDRLNSAMSRAASIPEGAIYIPSHDLDAPHAQLLETARTFWRAARARHTFKDNSEAS